MKRCSRCKLEKVESGFTKETSRTDGLRLWCKECSRKGKDSIKRCSMCRETKHNVYFSRDRSRKSGFNSRCKECLSVKVGTFKKFVNPPVSDQNLSEQQNKYLEQLLKRKKSDAKRKGVQCDFNLDWIREQFRKGCAVTGIAFEIGKKNPFSVEVDRVIPSGDYSIKNSRFVCAIYNRAKWSYSDEDVIKMTLALVINNWEQYKKHFKLIGLS